MTVYDDGFIVIREAHLRLLSEFGKWNQFRLIEMTDGELIFLANVDEAERSRAGLLHPLIQLFWCDLHVRQSNQFLTSTGVPICTLLKKLAAILSGIRTQPCDAAYPGRKPACIPMPRVKRMK